MQRSTSSRWKGSSRSWKPPRSVTRRWHKPPPADKPAYYVPPARTRGTLRHPARRPPAPPARSEVSIYIQVPQGVRAKQLDVSIKPQHLRVGIKELPPYLDVSRRPRQQQGGTGLRAPRGSATPLCYLAACHACRRVLAGRSRCLSLCGPSRTERCTSS